MWIFLHSASSIFIIGAILKLWFSSPTRCMREVLVNYTDISKQSVCNRAGRTRCQPWQPYVTVTVFYLQSNGIFTNILYGNNQRHHRRGAWAICAWAKQVVTVLRFGKPKRITPTPKVSTSNNGFITPSYFYYVIVSFLRYAVTYDLRTITSMSMNL